MNNSYAGLANLLMGSAIIIAKGLGVRMFELRHISPVNPQGLARRMRYYAEHFAAFEIDRDIL